LSNDEAFFAELNGNAPVSSVAGFNCPNPCPVRNMPPNPPLRSLLRKSLACNGCRVGFNPASVRSNWMISARPVFGPKPAS
jgi:hypothetical protein